MSKRNKIQIIAALLACVISIVFSGLIQTDFGKIEMTDITLETEAGNLTAYLFKPETATKENKAPAIVCLHGYLNNREMQDCNYVELARRGYVVIAMDGFAHGNSDVAKISGDNPLVKTNGMVAFVEYLSKLDYVDTSKIGCTGHSMGAQYTIATMTYYTELERTALTNGASKEEAHKLNKVNTGVPIGNYPTAMAQNKDGQTFLCHCTVIGAKYDEFFFGNTAVLLTSENSKNFVRNLIEEEPAMPLTEGKTYVSPSTGYTITLYNPAQFHATNHFSKTVVKAMLESVERTMPAPKKIPAGNQIWFVRELFTLLGLAGFFAFIVPFTQLLLNTKLFSSLKKEVRVYDMPEKKLYYKRNIMPGVINCLLIIPVMGLGYLLLRNAFWPQDTSGGIGLWSIACGLVTLSYIKKDFGKKVKLKDCDLNAKTNLKEFGLALLLSLAVVTVTYLLLFAADFTFQTDFRFWTFDIRSFPLKKVLVAIKYVPLYMLFYVVQSIGCSRQTFKEYSENKQILMCGLFNMLAPSIMLIVTYLPTPLLGGTTWVALCKAIGIEALASVFALIPILLIPFVPIMFITAAIAVRSYRQSGNVWIGALINTLMITMITIANTSFTFPY